MSNEKAYFICGILALYSLSCLIIAYRLIRSNRKAQRAKDAAAMNDLISQAYRILNNHHHEH